MDLHLEPDLAAKVEQWSAQTGRPAREVVEEAASIYIDEISSPRSELDARYDQIVERKVDPIDGAVAHRILHNRARARRRSIS
jgi:hypothetical protein